MNNNNFSSLPFQQNIIKSITNKTVTQQRKMREASLIASEINELQTTLQQKTITLMRLLK